MTNNKSNLSWLFIRHLAHNPDNYRDAWLSCWYYDKNAICPPAIRHVSRHTGLYGRLINRAKNLWQILFVNQKADGICLHIIPKNGILQVQIIRV